MGEALAAVFSVTTLLATALESIDCAPSPEAAEQALDDFERGPWGQR
jgi:hypothetical protein